jgi:hypothetical protein
MVVGGLLLATASLAEPPAKKAGKAGMDDQAMMAAMQKAAAIGPEHKQLQTFVGSWAVTTKF